PPAYLRSHSFPTRRSSDLLVMPDSAGSFLLPEVRYPYYDLVAGDYRAATIAPRALAVAPGIEPHAARALPPLWRGGAAAWVDELDRKSTRLNSSHGSIA